MNSPDVDDSFARLNYHQDSEIGVNEQINHEYSMSYQYHAMSNYFNRDNVGLPGFAAFFRASSLEERNHAQQLMDFQATRGGRVKLAALAAPPSDYNHEQKGDALYAMELALALEKLNFKMLFELHETAEKRKDANMTDFVEEMLSEQAQGVKEVSEYVAQLRRVGKGLGVYEFDAKMAQRATTLA
ncbi:ferritin [Coccomyxa subellipsoidea C-169]|uniref:Ferritin n=1 Tax=Coccomyxa subellipsoidea (strain C-169) TaxID=574566 RepID=I0YMH0_COCSC|nr:ferritin [Coccomyxa subellipsoidea C-169]EIE19589.1 ferritin [Coccomyxa subellipsoidea C-169]|eukprot:XP_005644133.1 ferritin [Coccomyxa subellipsoidea C-169]